MSFETPIMRDIMKLFMLISIGIACAFLVMIIFPLIAGEIRFIASGMESGYDVISDRSGGCFYNDNGSKCASNAWPINGLYVLVLSTAIPLNFYLAYYIKKTRNKIKQMRK